MVIVLIHWKIKIGMEDKFFAHWKKLSIEDSSGLIGEYLSEAAQEGMPEGLLPEWVTWHITSPNEDGPQDGEEEFKSYVNVGLWESAEDFEKQVGKNFKDSDPPECFELYRRKRTILYPKHWRKGMACPPKTSDGVE